MTETTQPDPQVVAWMRLHLSGKTMVKAEVIRAYQLAFPEETRGAGLRHLVDAYNVAARKPLTVADIPAAQGAASLFIGPDGDGELAAWFKRDERQRIRVMYIPQDAPGQDMPRAVWEVLAATLPTVTTEED